jgi:SAM-dependent methyltransferase
LWFGSFCKTTKIIPLATGNVLEIGIGTNLPLYDNKRVIRLTAIDPSEDTWNKCTIDTKKSQFDDDTVVVTPFALSLMQKALEEMRRVLKPTGLLLFVNTELLQKRSSKGR